MSEEVLTHELPIRVRYFETDQMGVVHHANYFVYFEMGRTEALRATGIDYRSLEKRGYMLVVAKIACQYRAPANYDDELILATTVNRISYARIDHTYILRRGETIVAEGSSTLACVDRNGRPQALPSDLRPSD
ncbi:Acyl-CoA thioester hydrolase YbgC [Planctomycetes bacterium Pan216]|uniref:Acyl-CoA thioester hydrolase YbgC n=1 Tax=Kolteria novifilia TaxID=2527975 RepID=A0A518AWZ8_9BACT|nr:Acyl-CoA thioester hydrolase YbgC [Planctomycetes bacterium Pan216]